MVGAICASTACAESGRAVESGCAKTPCGQTDCRCCKPVKTCKQIVYEEQQRTCYRPVFKEEMVERVVNSVEFVEETRYRCAPCTVWQPKPPSECGPCEPADCCGPKKPCEMVPVRILRKVAYTVVVPKCVQKTEKVPRTVVSMEPYTVTVCIPHVVCRPVPVCPCGPPKPPCGPIGTKPPCSD